MESLIRQTRVRFSDAGPGNKDEGSSIRNQRLPSQKTVSFKGDKKKQQNWLQRQFFGQMSKEYDLNNGGEYTAAIAAAAFAVKALEELNIKEQKKIIEEHEKTFNKTKSRTEDTSRVPEFGKISKRFSTEPSMRREDIHDKAEPAIENKDTKVPEKSIKPAPIRKALTFSEKQQNIPEKKPESVSPKKPDITYTQQLTLPSTKPGVEETEADAWEKAELAKIKERYEKLGITIGDWEHKKKEKAKRKKERTESELEFRRAKVLRNYRTEMDRINQIAAGARSQAEENRRNEEFKVKEKANRIRITGKIPATCLCF